MAFRTPGKEILPMLKQDYIEKIAAYIVED